MLIPNSKANFTPYHLLSTLCCFNYTLFRSQRSVVLELLSSVLRNMPPSFASSKMMMLWIFSQISALFSHALAQVITIVFQITLAFRKCHKRNFHIHYYFQLFCKFLQAFTLISSLVGIPFFPKVVVKTHLASANGLSYKDKCHWLSCLSIYCYNSGAARIQCL